MAQIWRACQRTDFCLLLAPSTSHKLTRLAMAGYGLDGVIIPVAAQEKASLVCAAAVIERRYGRAGSRILHDTDAITVSISYPTQLEVTVSKKEESKNLLAAPFAYNTVGNGLSRPQSAAVAVDTLKIDFIWLGRFSYHCSTASNRQFQRPTYDSLLSSGLPGYEYDAEEDDSPGPPRRKSTPSVCAQR